MKEKYEKGEIAKIILKSLLGATLVVTVVALPGVAHVFTLFKPRNGYDRRRVKQSIQNLEKNKFIRHYKRGEEDVIEITKKGRKKFLQYNFKEIKIMKPKKWDGLWRVVMFDIPENKKRIRGAINHKLKELGFYPMQKSVFIHPHNCREEIDFVGEYFNVRKYIQYIEAKNIDQEIKLKKKFGIQ